MDETKRANITVVFTNDQTKYFAADNWSFTDRCIMLHEGENQTIIPLDYILYAVVEAT